MSKRWGKSPEHLADSHPAWELEAEYLALALVNLIYAYSPKRIILGGGVSQHPGLHERVRYKVKQILNDYVHSPLLSRMDEYILLPALGNRSGGLGAIAMAMRDVSETDGQAIR